MPLKIAVPLRIMLGEAGEWGLISTSLGADPTGGVRGGLELCGVGGAGVMLAWLREEVLHLGEVCCWFSGP